MISVIVPIYNVEKYLAKCVESVFAQTYTDYELILVDDGTGDSGGAMSDEYALCDTRVVTIHKPNGGLSDARNWGLEIERGEYINFLDSDDYVMSEMLEKMLAAMKKSNADMCLCGFNNINEKGEVLDTKTYGDAVLTRDEALEMLVQGNVVFITAWAKLYKRYIFNDLRYVKGKIHEDEFAAHYIHNKCEKIVSLGSLYYMYLQRRDSIVGTPKKLNRFNGVEAYIDREIFFRTIGENAFAARVLAQTIPLLCSTRKYFEKTNILASEEEKRLRKILIKEIKNVNCDLLPVSTQIGIKTYLIGPLVYNCWHGIYVSFKKHSDKRV